MLNSHHSANSLEKSACAHQVVGRGLFISVCRDRSATNKLFLVCWLRPVGDQPMFFLLLVATNRQPTKVIFSVVGTSRRLWPTNRKKNFCWSGLVMTNKTFLFLLFATFSDSSLTNGISINGFPQPWHTYLTISVEYFSIKLLTGSQVSRFLSTLLVWSDNFPLLLHL